MNMIAKELVSMKNKFKFTLHVAILVGQTHRNLRFITPRSLYAAGDFDHRTMSKFSTVFEIFAVFSEI